VIGPQFTGDAELIAAQNPDVVFYVDGTVQDLDGLQSKIGKPVVGITYGGLSTDSERQTFYDGLSLMGKILNKEDRAQKVIDYVQGIIDDCNNRTKNIPDASKPTVYVGGLSSRGNHGFTSTTAYYAPFMMTNSKNVVTADMAKNSTQVVNIDSEALPGLNPDVIFVDYNGLSLSAQDVANHPEVYDSLNAIKNNQTYGLMGYNWYALNFEVALTDAYYVGKVLYPNQFADIDAVQKANEIYAFLDGAPLYDQMTELYGPFSSIDLT
jgi:iron complex transport system substrate-binding protein